METENWILMNNRFRLNTFQPDSCLLTPNVIYRKFKQANIVLNMHRMVYPFFHRKTLSLSHIYRTDNSTSKTCVHV